MSEPDMEVFREAFNELSGGDDKITHADLKKALEKGGAKPTDDEIKAIIELADAEGTGYISFDEFCKVIVGVQFVKIRIAAGLQQLFSVLDADGSGYITADNLKKICEESGAYDKVAKDKIDEIMKKCDQTGDGKIGFEEFVDGILMALDEAQ